MEAGEVIARMARFTLAWAKLANGGVCDEPGGEEYWEVFRAWWDGGCPDDIDSVIRGECSEAPQPEDEP